MFLSFKGERFFCSVVFIEILVRIIKKAEMCFRPCVLLMNTTLM